MKVKDAIIRNWQGIRSRWLGTRNNTSDPAATSASPAPVASESNLEQMTQVEDDILNTERYLDVFLALFRKRGEKDGQMRQSRMDSSHLAALWSKTVEQQAIIHAEGRLDQLKSELVPLRERAERTRQEYQQGEEWIKIAGVKPEHFRMGKYWLFWSIAVLVWLADILLSYSIVNDVFSLDRIRLGDSELGRKIGEYVIPFAIMTGVALSSSFVKTFFDQYLLPSLDIEGQQPSRGQATLPPKARLWVNLVLAVVSLVGVALFAALRAKVVMDYDLVHPLPWPGYLKTAKVVAFVLLAVIFTILSGALFAWARFYQKNHGQLKNSVDCRQTRYDEMQKAYQSQAKLEHQVKVYQQHLAKLQAHLSSDLFMRAAAVEYATGYEQGLQKPDGQDQCGTLVDAAKVLRQKVSAAIILQTLK